MVTKLRLEKYFFKNKKGKNLPPMRFSRCGHAHKRKRKTQIRLRKIPFQSRPFVCWCVTLSTTSLVLRRVKKVLKEKCAMGERKKAGKSY